jgi:pimeloyl-ACP methyl ester carboxylesterase
VTATSHLLDRQVVTLSAGDVAYADVGSGAPALFIHGVILNADLWANAIHALSGHRRCIALDLPMHGATRVREDTDLSLPGLTKLLLEFCDALQLETVDVVANDTGAALAQSFAAHHPHRIRTLALTNCDVHDNFPPARFRAATDLAARGEFAPLMLAMANDYAIARSAEGLGLGYEHPDRLTDERIASYLEPFRIDEARGLERFMTSASAADLMAIEGDLGRLHAPTLVVWGTGDLFFEPFWAKRLEAMIPGVEDVIEIQGAMLFYPDERADELVPHIRRHWLRHSPVAPTTQGPPCE